MPNTVMFPYDLSVNFGETLRFDIAGFEILDSAKEWRSLSLLTGKFKSPYSQTEIPICMKWFLLDTGNEKNYIVLTAHYFHDFIQHFQLSPKNCEDEYYHGDLDKPMQIKRSTTEFVFRLFGKLLFTSKIGFTNTFGLDWYSIANIGIKNLAKWTVCLRPGSPLNCLYLKI